MLEARRRPCSRRFPVHFGPADGKGFGTDLRSNPWLLKLSAQRKQLEPDWLDQFAPAKRRKQNGATRQAQALFRDARICRLWDRPAAFRRAPVAGVRPP